MPYLHERKIWLNMKTNHDQFYTIYRNEEGLFIVCINFDMDRVMIYTETGILLMRIYFKSLVQEIGKPVCVSSNGRFLLFRKSIYSAELALTEITLEEGIKLVKKINIKDRITQQV